MQTGGASYQWLRNNMCREKIAEGSRLGISPYELMNREAEKSPPGGKGLLFLPYLMGERSPHWNPAARGVFLGLTLSHTRADMIRAVLEGVSFNLRIILDAFIAQGVRIPAVRVIGGGARGGFWRQILADIFNRPVEKLTFPEEATSLGAAIAGGVAFGIFKDFQVAKEISQVAETQRPRPESRDLYDRTYVLFQEAYEALVPIYAKMQSL